jgi:hypothetical protein
MTMTRSQDLSAGDHSTNSQAGRDSLQAGRDLVQADGNVYLVNGITYTYDQIRQIALDVYNSNFLKLAGVAEDIARDRAERITREFLETLQARSPASLASMSDPDMLRTLYAAQEGFACSGEDDLEAALIDLLVDRAGQTERDLKTHVLNQAIATLPKLTKRHRAATTVIFATKYTQYAGPLDLSTFYDYLTQYLVPFVADIPESSADFGYMEYTGVGSVITFASVILANVYGEQACGFFSNGFTREAAPEPWTPFLDDPEVFVPCLRDPKKLQIRARSMTEVLELSKTKGIPTLVTNAKTGRMQQPEIKDDMIAHLPSLEALFERWGDSGTSELASFGLTAVGIAIGHACQRKIVGEMTPLEHFLV